MVLLGGGPNNLNLYNSADDSGNVYSRNGSLWIPADFTCIPVASSSNGAEFNGVLVTPDILIQAAHAHSTGTIYFVAPDNTVHSRTIIGTSNPTGDILVARLDSPLPAEIKPALILPSDYASKLPLDHLSTQFALSVYTGQAREINIGSVTQFTSLVHVIKPDNDVVQPWYSPVQSGGSGAPAFFVIDGQTVALGVWSGSNFTDLAECPGLHVFSSQINAAIISLGSATQMTEIDLSAYPDYP